MPRLGVPPERWRPVWLTAAAGGALSKEQRALRLLLPQPSPPARHGCHNMYRPGASLPRNPDDCNSLASPTFHVYILVWNADDFALVRLHSAGASRHAVYLQTRKDWQIDRHGSAPAAGRATWGRQGRASRWGPSAAAGHRAGRRAGAGTGTCRRTGTARAPSPGRGQPAGTKSHIKLQWTSYGPTAYHVNVPAST